MAALLTRVAEAVRVGSLWRSQVCCSLERVAMVSDPFGLIVDEVSVVFLFDHVFIVGVLEIGEAFEVMMADAVIHDLRMSQLGMQQ